MFKKLFIILFLNLFVTQFTNANIEIKARTAICKIFVRWNFVWKEPDRSIYPASMTKIMTSIIAFDLIKSGDLDLNEKFTISEKAWRLSTSGYSSDVCYGWRSSISREFIKRNNCCIRKWCLHSISWRCAGTEEEFAIMMTAKANEIGMENTNLQIHLELMTPTIIRLWEILWLCQIILKNIQNFMNGLVKKNLHGIERVETYYSR